MAGRGPAPKAPEKRARRNADAIKMKVLEVKRAQQPKLDELYSLGVNDEGEAIAWPQTTLRWWDMWGRSPLTDDFTEVDWDELGITAMLHARVAMGAVSYASEYRLRAMKFGATPEDRARLRISLVAADEATAKSVAKRSASKSRYDGIKLAK